MKPLIVVAVCAAIALAGCGQPTHNHAYNRHGGPIHVKPAIITGANDLWSSPPTPMVVSQTVGSQPVEMPTAQCQPGKTLYTFPLLLSYPESCQGDTAGSLIP